MKVAFKTGFNCSQNNPNFSKSQYRKGDTEEVTKEVKASLEANGYIEVDEVETKVVEPEVETKVVKPAYKKKSTSKK